MVWDVCGCSMFPYCSRGRDRLGGTGSVEKTASRLVTVGAPVTGRPPVNTVDMIQKTVLLLSAWNDFAANARVLRRGCRESCREDCK
jgi:hypothetical protein